MSSNQKFLVALSARDRAFRHAQHAPARLFGEPLRDGGANLFMQIGLAHDPPLADAALHEEVCATISAWLAEQPGWRVLGMTESPITGAEGNKEFLIAGAFSG